jgi:hypothetical protein
MPIQVHDLFKHSDLTLIVEVSNNNLTWVKFGQNRSVDNLSRCRDGDLDIPTLGKLYICL